jgi:hypothetical protein
MQEDDILTEDRLLFLPDSNLAGEISGGSMESQPRHPRTIKGSFQSFIPESREILGSMMPWNWNSYLPGVALGVTTIPLIHYKDEIQRNMGLGDGGEIRFVDSNNFSSHFKFLGDRWPVPAVTGAFLLGGLISGSQREVETGLMLAQSLFFTGAVTLTGQFVLSEDRPHEGGELNFLKVGGHGISGHSAMASLIIGPLDSQYFRLKEEDGTALTTMKYLGKGILYTAPVLTGMSRVRSNRHYLWNVVLGLATGYSVGTLVADAHESDWEDKNEKSLSWDVNVDLQGICLGLKW